MPTQQRRVPPGFEEYAKQLVDMPEKNICPKCYAAGRRKKFCTNMVILGSTPADAKLVCCWLGDRDEIDPQAFEKKLAEFRAHHKP